MSVPISCGYRARKEGRLTTVDMHEVRTQITRLLARVEAGEDVVLLRDGKPVPRLAPLTEKRTKRRFGVLRGKVEVDDSFFDPLPEEERGGFE
jgi:antitoxin (DNA-binding transcriptional repressor) of toxin-antitoxin stability system